MTNKILIEFRLLLNHNGALVGLDSTNYNFYKKTTSYWEDIYINDIYNLRYEKLIINREDEIKK